VVNQVIQNKDVTRSLAIRSGGIFQKKPRKKFAGKAMVTTATNEVQPTVEDKSQSTANVARPGICGKANVFSTTSKDNTWIIDTGASDHMVRDSGQLQSLNSSTHSFISTANGSTSPTAGEGSVILSKTLALNSVLVVLSLEYNLLSVGQITYALNCTVTFWPSFCVFQDILTRKILGYGVKRDKLYYLELTETEGQKFSRAYQARSLDTDRETIWLWHRRLGRLSLDILENYNHIFLK